MRQRSPWLWNDTLYDFLPSGREHKKCLKVLHDFTNKVITINNNNDNDDDDDDDVLMSVRDLASRVFAYSKKNFIILFCSSEKLAQIFSLKDRSILIENDKLLTFGNLFPSLRHSR